MSKLKKTNNEYSEAWDELYKDLPKWKKDMIDEMKISKKEDAFYVSFIKEVIKKAESSSCEKTKSGKVH
jgi:hypothetical protein